ncbi:SDR family oxidoreductase [Austwickia chelonae]|uniref:SDR family oxidoreductase n=1 Tax=Austwickia chelonae TaxID=100225 RepID=UPI000E23EC4A|nr:SDR family oxidoreductase [Austwickia chelonae]
MKGETTMQVAVEGPDPEPVSLVRRALDLIGQPAGSGDMTGQVDAACLAVAVNAALGAPRSAADIDRSRFEAHAAELVSRGSGRLILVSDIGPGSRRGGGFHAEAAELLGWWEQLVVDAARHGVSACHIQVGYSPEAGHALTGIQAQHVLRYQPLRRGTRAEDLASAFDLLLAPAGGYLVGETLRVDGGAHLGCFPAIRGDGSPGPSRAEVPVTGSPGLLQGQVALVTGASSGIGRAISLELAARGADVVLAARRVDKLDEVAHEIVSGGSQAWTLETDLSDPAAAASLVDRAWAAAGGPVHRLACSAGQLGLAEPGGEGVRRTTMQVNFFSSATVTENMVTRWVDRGLPGSAVAVSSVSSTLAPVALLENYGPSKAALSQHHRALAVSVGRCGIRTNTVCPGIIQTDMGDVAEEMHRRGWLSRIPLGRVGTPAEVAAVVGYLLASGSEMVTGTAPRIDGGFGLGWVAGLQDVRALCAGETS